jgi:hypothetical protein
MQRDDVQSRVIRTIGYDAELQILEIEFHPRKGQTEGAVYQYANFLPPDWSDFRQASSIGHHFATRISGIFPTTKMPPAAVVDKGEGNGEEKAGGS